MESTSLRGLSLLVVEDDLLLRRQIAALLEREGADVTAATTVAEARRQLQQLDFDFLLLDIHLPDGSGLDLLRERGIPAGLGVIVMTAEVGVASAVEALRLGAVDYLSKPFELEAIPLVITRARHGRQRARLEEHRRSLRADPDFYFGESLADLERTLKKVLEADARMRTHLPPVLIQGETGTGKTTVARWLHHHGPRADGPLVEMNCSALPETLAESELFGHERGAFTDARATRIGLFEAADGGTLFLDELPSLSVGLQAKVLTVIEDHRIRRVGGRKEIPVDVRIIAATSVDLRQRVSAGRFREDLFHRLDLYRVWLPPLRERGEDVLALASQMLTALCRRHRVASKRLSAEGQQRLRRHAWPGNARELAHELERALVFEEGEELELRQLPSAASDAATTPPRAEEWFQAGFVFPEQGFDLEQAINRLIRHALQQSGHNVSAAARLLGVTRDYVRYRLAALKESPVAGSSDPAEGSGG